MARVKTHLWAFLKSLDDSDDRRIGHRASARLILGLERRRVTPDAGTGRTCRTQCFQGFDVDWIGPIRYLRLSRER
jgi:hypothetical protein